MTFGVTVLYLLPLQILEFKKDKKLNYKQFLLIQDLKLNNYPTVLNNAPQDAGIVITQQNVMPVFPLKPMPLLVIYVMMVMQKKIILVFLVMNFMETSVTHVMNKTAYVKDLQIPVTNVQAYLEILTVIVLAKMGFKKTL